MICMLQVEDLKALLSSECQQPINARQRRTLRRYVPACNAHTRDVMCRRMPLLWLAACRLKSWHMLLQRDTAGSTGAGPAAAGRQHV